MEGHGKSMEPPSTTVGRHTAPRTELAAVQKTKRWLKPRRAAVEGITKQDIRRLARRGGVKRISGLIYDDLRTVLKVFLQKLIGGAVIYAEHAHRRTIMVNDVVHSCKRNGITLYGCGGFEVAGAVPLTRAQKLARLCTRPVPASPAGSLSAQDLNALVRVQLGDLFEERDPSGQHTEEITLALLQQRVQAEDRTVSAADIDHELEELCNLNIIMLIPDTRAGHAGEGLIRFV